MNKKFLKRYSWFCSLAILGIILTSELLITISMGYKAIIILIWLWLCGILINKI